MVVKVGGRNYGLAMICGENQGVYLVGSFWALGGREELRVGRHCMSVDDWAGLGYFDFGRVGSCIWRLNDLVLVLVLLRD